MATLGFSPPVTGLAAFRWFRDAVGGIEKMRSIFFQRSKNSGVAVIPPLGGTGCGGERYDSKGKTERSIIYGLEFRVHRGLKYFKNEAE